MPSGEDDVVDGVECVSDVAAGRSVNLYPHVPGTTCRLADPICDFARCQV